MLRTKAKVREIYGEQIEAIAKNAHTQAQGASYVVYLILDPTLPDPHGLFPSTPIYVGQTGRIYGRIKDHCEQALVYGGPEGSLKAILTNLIESGNPPAVMVAQLCNNTISSRFAETRWAQKLLAMGYKLKNRAPLQRSIMTTKQRINFERHASMAGALERIT